VLRQALLEAGAIRFKPIFLTAAAAMIGAAFIMADPIFQGLAISLSSVLPRRLDHGSGHPSRIYLAAR
jgi:multidrug efflux pump subunit AcrB